MDQPIYLVALEYERRQLVAGGLPADQVNTCGPGREGVRRWADQCDPGDRPVVFIGLAGGLDPSLERGQVVVASQIVDTHGQIDTPPLDATIDLDAPRLRVATAGRLVVSPEAKQALRRLTTGALVDLESSHFAEVANDRGWRWGVIRVVGDTAEESIPSALERFVDHTGRTRWREVASEIFRRPGLVAVLRRIASESRTALRRLASELVDLRIPKSEAPASDQRRGRVATGPRTVLVYGGTFDPPHRGHVTLAFEAAGRLGCHELMFMPARVNPLRQQTPPTDAELRVEMLEAALADHKSEHPGVRVQATVSRMEIDREGPSYMIDTLQNLQQALMQEVGETASDTRHRPRMRLLIGSDQAMQFDQWRRWREIIALAPPAVMPRPPANRTTLAAAYREAFPSDLASRWATWTLDLPLDGVSSTEIRAAVGAGDPIEHAVSPGVLRVIRREGLYSGGSDFQSSSPRPPRDSSEP